jgi:hypothetical protein
MSYFPSLTQNVIPDVNNTVATTLTAGATWNAAGTGTNTLTTAAIQMIVKSTENMTIYVEQGSGATSMQLTDTYDYNVLKGNFGLTIQMVGAFVRVSAKNIGGSTATFSIDTVLCPIVEAVPRTLGNDIQGQHLKVGLYHMQDEWGNAMQVSPAGWLDVNQPYRVVGTAFGSAIDTTFWTATNNGTASASGVANSIATITSGTGANAWGQIVTVRAGRFVFNNAMKTKQLILIPTVVTANTNRYWGAYTATAGSAGVLPTVIDGFYFALSGAGVLSVNTRNAGGTVNSVASGAFNGDVSTYVLDTNVHAYEIVYYIAKCQFYVDNLLVHTFTPTTAILTATCTLPIGAMATTSGTNSGTIQMWAGTIHRLGRDLTAPIWLNRAGAVTAQVAKSGPGVLRVFSYNSNAVNGTVTIYDAVTATNPILTVTTNNVTPATWNLDLEFYTGLCYTTSAANHNITLVFE